MPPALLFLSVGPSSIKRTSSWYMMYCGHSTSAMATVNVGRSACTIAIVQYDGRMLDEIEVGASWGEVPS